jgi:hypothetical protein
MQKQIQKEKDAVIAARIPKTLKALILKIIAVDAHINESDFLRDAIREKVQRDAPELYSQLFKLKGESS